MKMLNALFLGSFSTLLGMSIYNNSSPNSAVLGAEPIHAPCIVSGFFFQATQWIKNHTKWEPLHVYAYEYMCRVCIYNNYVFSHTTIGSDNNYMLLRTAGLIKY